MGIWSEHGKMAVDTTSGKEPATLEHLAEVEKNILKMLDVLDEKLLLKESGFKGETEKGEQ